MAKNLANVANAVAAEAMKINPAMSGVLIKATADNAADFFKPILEYQPVMNTFIDVMVNKIYMQMFRARNFHNPLASLKKGSAPLGGTIEEIHVNPVEGQAYNPTATTLLQQAAPDAATAYYNINRKDLYKLTITRDDIAAAFTTWEAFGHMIDTNVNALYSGNYIDEFRLMLGAFNGALQNDAIVPLSITAPTDASTGKAMLAKMRALNRKFQLPSTAYNSFKQLSPSSGNARKTWCRPEDVIVVISADTEALLDVDVIAAAFHADRSQFVASQVVVVDGFGENSPIQAIMCDRAWLNVLDNLYLAEPFRNPETLATTYFLHVWQTMGCSPFANGVALVSSTGTYTLTAEQPDDWAANYTAYYTASGTVYPVYTPVPAGDAAPTWKANTYYAKS